MWSRLQVPVPYTRTDHPTRSCSRSELSYNVIPIPRPVMPLQPWVSGAANEAYEIPVHVETRGHELRLPGSLAFVSRQIPDLPPLKMRGPRAAEYNCTGRSVILGVCPRLSQPFAVKTVSTERKVRISGGSICVSVARSLLNPCPACAQPGVRRQRIDSPGSTAEHSWCPWLTGDPAGLGPKICSATGRYIRWTKRSARA